MRSARHLVLFTILTLILPTGWIRAQVAPAPGSNAPDFQLQGATADSILSSKVRLSELTTRGPVILAFYPADWSGGCTKEMCTLRDNFAALGELGVTILGISGDYVFSHREWAQHLGLQFTLLSDHDHQVARAYGSYNPASGFNMRTVFIVDTHGLVRYADTAYRSGDPASFAALRTALSSVTSPVTR